MFAQTIHAGLGLTLLALPAHPDTWVVDGGGSGDFTDIQPAVDAAVEGDEIWILVGDYGTVTVSGKSLHLVGQVGPGGWPPIYCDQVLVENLGPQQRVLISGLVIEEDSTAGGVELVVRDCIGAVRMQHCRIGEYNSWATTSDPVARVRNSRNIAFLSCRFYAQDSSVTPGVRLEDSSVSFWSCHVRGSNGEGSTGEPWNNEQGTDGATGCEIVSSFLFAAETTFWGGHGADCVCGEPGDGGNGMEVSGDSRVELLSCAVRGGFGGGNWGWGCYWGDGEDGEDLIMFGPAVVHELPGFARSWEPDDIAFHGAYFHIDITGVPGDKVYVVRAPTPVSLFRPSLSGMQFLEGIPEVHPYLGVIDSHGSLSVDLPISQVDPPGNTALGSSIADCSILLQMYAIDSQNQVWAGPPAQLLIPDPAPR